MPAGEEAGLPEARTETDRTSRARRWPHLRRILGVLVVLAVVTELILPWTFGTLGKRAANRANADLRDCGRLDAARSAERWFSWQASSPGWGDTAKENKRDLSFQIVNGVNVCAISKPTPDGFVDRAVAYLAELLRDIDPESEASAGYRYHVEDMMHRFGRDRAIVDLEAELPAGGDVAERVRAHLYLGDLQGAVAVWRQQGAHLQAQYASQLLTQGVVMCMGGDYETALPAFERRRELLGQEPNAWRLPQHLAGYAECAIRAGKPELATALAEQNPSAAFGPYYRAVSALEQGDFAAAEAAIATMPPHTNSQYAALHCGIRARAGDLLGTLQASQAPSLHHEVVSLSGGERVRANLYNSIYFPVIDERYLLEAAALLAEPADDSRAAEMRRAAAELYALVAARLGRRWDPRANELLDRCRELAPDWSTPDHIDALLAFLHGDWKRFDQRADGNLDDLRALREQLLSAAAQPGKGDPPNTDGLALSSLHPNGTETFELIAALLTSRLSPAQKLEALRLQKLEAELPSLFFRLTNLVVYGRLLGVDVTPFEEQLASLRAMLAAQANLMLFTGHTGAPTF